MRSLVKLLFVVLVLMTVGMLYYQRLLTIPTITQPAKPQLSDICNALTKITPHEGETVTSPLTVSITIDNRRSCKWTVFEAMAGSVTLKDGNDQIMGTAVLTTTDEWMTDKPVTYTGTLEFPSPPTSELQLVILEEDPSGEGSQTVTIPLNY